MNECEFLINEIIANDFLKMVKSEFSVECDYLIHREGEITIDSAINELLELTLRLSDRAEEFYNHGCITFTKFNVIQAQIHEQYRNTKFYLTTIVYNESEEYDNEEDTRPMDKSYDGRVRRNRRG